ncbi:MAG TPA: MgtC/SapB family protein [Bacteroidia bacterium]|nr:MgtC/SapB family protein [Bacteroidia bacterium]
MSPDFIEEDITKLIISLIAGSIIGAEREYNNKNAGFRTVILVTLGATLFTILSGLLTQGKDFHVAGNVVVGIGFLGAGAIFKEGNTVKGITTAATIWVSAAIGMAIGIGEFSIAIASVFIVMLVLLGFIWLQSFIDQFNREKTYKITVLCQKYGSDEINHFFIESNLKNTCVYRHKIGEKITYTHIVKGPEKNHQKLISLLQNNIHVIEFEV